MLTNPKAVAVVDDDLAVLEATACFLKSIGYEVHAFGSGEAFLHSDRREDVSCLITDVSMPGLTGLGLLRRIRAARPALSVLMMTGAADDSTRRRALAWGAREVLRKPVSADELAHHLMACA